MSANSDGKERFNEWSKWVIFKMGHWFGFPSAMLAAVVGCLIWGFCWLVLPHSFHLILGIPMLGAKLATIGVTVSGLSIANWLMIGVGTICGAACWCSAIVQCYPKVYDQYKIKAGLHTIVGPN